MQACVVSSGCFGWGVWANCKISRSAHPLCPCKLFKNKSAPLDRPIMPVTKEEVRAEKERLKTVDSRPIKKVAEAKMRKQRRLVSKLTQAREKAETIANQVRWGNSGSALHQLDPSRVKRSWRSGN